MRSSTDRHWQKLGSTEPYFAVLTDLRFVRAAEPGPDRDALFLSGETDVARLFATIRANVAEDFAPERALDFGCGVGRLVVPLARRVREVVGIDVSPGMLAEARRNIEEAKLDNVTLACMNDAATLDGTFDVIHSWIVFQHIRPAHGLAIARDLVARRRVPGLHAVANLLKRRAPTRPLMEMNAYPLPRLLELVRQAGAQHVSFALTDHDGCRSALLLFARPR